MLQHSLSIQLSPDSLLGKLMHSVANSHYLMNPFSYSVFLMGALVFAAWIAGRDLKRVPGPFQNFMEFGVEFVRNQAIDVMGAKADRYLPLFVTLFSFILVSNLFGLIPGMDSPTANLSVNAAMAVIVFFATHWTGVKTMGTKGYLSHFLAPEDLDKPIRFVLSCLFVPLHFISECVRPVSLTLRLFGNISAKEILLGSLAMMAATEFTKYTLLGISVGGGAFALRVAILLLGVLVSIIQAGVFTILTIIYIGLVSEEHDEEAHA